VNADGMQRPGGNRRAMVVEEMAGRSPSHPAIIQDGCMMSYRELEQRSVAAARALLATGISRGDRIGVLLGNQSEWVILSLAASLIGAGFVPLNTWYKQTELSWTIRHCGLKLLISATRFLKTDFADILLALVPEARGAAPAAIKSQAYPALRSLIFVGDEIPSGSIGWDEFLRLETQVSVADLRSAVDKVSADDIAFVLYTSGSTAEPKGVLLDHRGVVGNGFALGGRRGIIAEDRVWLGSPLFYGLGATNALPATFTRGATLVLQGHFEAGRAIAAIEQSAATVYYGTGNMTRAILDHPEYRQSRIGSLQKGNAGTVAEYKRLTLVELGIRGAVPAYGLTESYGNATVGWPDDPLEAKLGTNGTPLPGMEMRIVDPQTGRDLPQGQTGLVLLRGFTTPGYLNNPEETAKALRPDGFFDTGDLGWLDGDGRFHFHSRLKEVIKSGGINISPVEVEQIIAGHPDVRDAYVVGLSDPVKGELIVAFVDSTARLSKQDIQAYVKERAASFKVPHHVMFRSEDELPRLASGKVAKYRLAEEAKRELSL
jgi:fatty-acyl-CoA synthase